MELPAASAASAPGHSEGRIIRFAGFEVIPAAGEVRKNGVRLRLGGQPFRILLMLLEHRGQVVTREALRRQLWPDHTHVDFDHCLNTAISKLRETLGDSAEKPRFIQTIPRHGYRFLAPTEEIGSGPPAVTSWGNEVASPKMRVPARWLIGGLAALLTALAVRLFWLSAPTTTAPATALPLTDFSGMETTPSLSPDGSEMVFCWSGQAGENFDIYVKPVGRGKLRRLTDNPADEFGPRYSPDGRRIAFYRRSGDYAAVYSVSPSGERTERMFGLAFGPPGRKGPEDPDWGPENVAWSQAGNQLAVVDRDSPNGPLRIFLRDLATGSMRPLTFPPEGSYGDGSPSFSPDGKFLAFVRRSSRRESEIFIAPVARGSARRIIAAGGRVLGLTWTADGRRIVFSSDRSGEARLWTVSVPEGELEPVAEIPEGALFPWLCPRTGRLAYARLAEAGYLMKVGLPDAAGTASEPVRLLPFPASTPQLSSDGARIAFSASYAGASQIWVSEASGAQARRLTSMPVSAGSPRWSPDGGWVAFDSLDRSGWDVYAVRADGADLRNVTAQEGSDVRPSWSADGRWLYFGSDRGGTMEIWKIPVSGGRAIQVTFQGGYDAVESPDGKRIFYTRRGVPGLWTRPAEGGAGAEEKLLLEELDWHNSRNWTVRADGVYFVACNRASLAGRV